MDNVPKRAPLSASKFANKFVELIIQHVSITEMKSNRGAGYADLQSYQIRFKPNDINRPLNLIIEDIVFFLQSELAADLDIETHKINSQSKHSSKFSSISFVSNSIEYDIVITKGANKGETFEKNILTKMQKFVSRQQFDEDVNFAFSALYEADKKFHTSNIVAVHPRTGSTQRSADIPLHDTGKIIADIIIELNNGTLEYISLKNKNGSSVGQFGLSKCFFEDFTVNTECKEWFEWLEPFKLDLQKISKGLIAAKLQSDIDWPDIEPVNINIEPYSPIYNILRKIWGSHYYYLREKNRGFYAMYIDSDTLDCFILKNLHITEIRYPCKSRKQITIYLRSDFMKFKIEIRNPNGKGNIKPTQIQLIMSNSK